MPWVRVTRDYLPSLMLAAFGAALEWVSWTLGQAVPTNCPTGYGSLQPCLNPGYQSQIAAVSIELLFAGIALLVLSALVAGLTHRYRARSQGRTGQSRGADLARTPTDHPKSADSAHH